VQDGGPGHGGRLRGQDLFLFSYFTGDERWNVQLNESMVRQIADGHHQTMDVDRHSVKRLEDVAVRVRQGPAILMWGQGVDEAIQVLPHELRQHLDLLAANTVHPRLVRLWSVFDDLMVIGITKEEWLLAIAKSSGEYAMSQGLEGQTEPVVFTDVEGKTLEVRWSDCIRRGDALDHAERFAADGSFAADRFVVRVPSLVLALRRRIVEVRAALALK